MLLARRVEAQAQAAQVEQAAQEELLAAHPVQAVQMAQPGLPMSPASWEIIPAAHIPPYIGTRLLPEKPGVPAPAQLTRRG